MDLNIVTFIFFALAVVIFIQLRNVLGRRTGHERPPFDVSAAPAEDAREKTEETAAKAEAAPADPYAAVDAYAPAGSALNEALRSVVRADGNFNPHEFLAGAGKAYEMILTAFAQNNLGALKPLLSEAVYADFAAAAAARQSAGEEVKFSFVGLNKADITDAELENGKAILTVAFQAEIISATYDKAGKKIDGDEQEIVALQDCWSFARLTDAKTPDWLLISTEGESER